MSTFVENYETVIRRLEGGYEVSNDNIIYLMRQAKEREELLFTLLSGDMELDKMPSMTGWVVTIEAQLTGEGRRKLFTYLGDSV
jgi:hypothetical protein